MSGLLDFCIKKVVDVSIDSDGKPTIIVSTIAEKQVIADTNLSIQIECGVSGYHYNL